MTFTKTCLSIINTSVWPSIYLEPRQRVGGALLFSACPSVCLSVCPDVCLSVPAPICLSVCCYDHSNLVIFNQIYSKFQIWIAFIKLWLKFEYGFFPTNDNQDGWQNGRRLSVCIYRGHSNLVILIRFLPNFIHVYGLLPSNPGSSLNMSFVWQMITKMANKMAAAYQFVSARYCGHSYLVILFWVFPIFIYIDCLYQTLVQVWIWIQVWIR